jgi:GTP-binding protein
MLNPQTLIYTNTRFMQSAAKFTQCPQWDGVEIAFAGRSNAGKSSALNALTEQTKLARTSKTPGRTQLINFFQVDETPYRLVDLPGYGFAKVPKAIKIEWQKQLSTYLDKRECLRGLVLVMDIRHPMTEFDKTMVDWAHESNMPLHILLTKADKLKRGPASATMLQVRKAVSNMGDMATVQMFSSTKNDGVKELRKHLTKWFMENTVVEGEEEHDGIEGESALFIEGNEPKA